ncbi:MAG: DUF4760 domain-containing protein [Anaerolineales bacterium]|nr:DUF4760 domain-containing protein [Anaerolineales bacterium]
MSAPTYEDATIMLQLARLGAEMGNQKATRFFWGDKYKEDFTAFKEKYPPGSKEYQYVNQICDWYEMLGALWVNGLLNEKLISDWVAPGMVWERVKGFALGVREQIGSPEIYEHFEALAKKLA